MSESISELVWLYIKKRPFLKEMLRERIANYSALARKISFDAFGSKKKGNENAIKMALVRMTNKIREREEDLEGKILSVLRGSSLSIRSKVAVVISSREMEKLKYLSYVESKGGIMYIVEESELVKLDQRQKTILRVEKNLNLISVHSPPAIEETPGVIAHVLDSFAGEGINVIEFVSCYFDTLLVLKEADTTRAYEILSTLTS